MTYAAAFPSDTASRADAIRPIHQRAHGELIVTLKTRDGATVLDDLRQDGCLKARFPNRVDWMEVVTLNSSGGIAGGDTLRSTLRVREGARATFAAQAAERIYRALQDDLSRIDTTITIEADAAAEWLPQETILFDRCAYRRTLDVHVAATGRFLGLETLVFGRTAMGETVTTARISDTIRLHQAGRLVLHDAIRLDGAVAETLARRATAGGCAAMTTILLSAPDAADRVDPLREALGPDDAGVSAWNGLLVARIVAQTGAALRAAIVASLHVLRDGRSLPRVWQC